MLLSRNKIKYLNSLKTRKYRNIHGHFIIEGDKTVRDIIQNKNVIIRQLIATKRWLSANEWETTAVIQEVIEADESDFSRISSWETPPEVMVVLDIVKPSIDHSEVSSGVSLALDRIQDPGNLGTIIRTANWFGIRNIFCNEGCADCFNPKVVQATMGAIMNVKIHVVNICKILADYKKFDDYGIWGAFMSGRKLSDYPPITKGMIVFGNESRGIDDSISTFVQHRITIPALSKDDHHVESLNVASAVAIVCAHISYT
jgi:RNA methyltransferase, TrmH family